MEYRKIKGKDTWHFCTNCQNWPTTPGTYDVSYSKPGGEFCNECLGKEKQGNCTKKN